MNVRPESAGLLLGRNYARIRDGRQSCFVIIDRQSERPVCHRDGARYLPGSTNRIAPRIFPLNSHLDFIVWSGSRRSNCHQFRWNAGTNPEGRRLRKFFVDVSGVTIDEYLQLECVFEERLHFPAWRATRRVANCQCDGFAFSQVTLQNLDVDRAAPRTAKVFDVVAKLQASSVGSDCRRIVRRGWIVELRQSAVGCVSHYDFERTGVVDSCETGSVTQHACLTGTGRDSALQRARHTPEFT